MPIQIHVDGGSRGNPGPSAAGVLIRDADGQTLLEAGYLLGGMTSNQAEYQALLIALRYLKKLPPEPVVIYSDSELMVRQITGVYKVKSQKLSPLHQEAERLLISLPAWKMRHVNRQENHRADKLLNQALNSANDVIVVDAVGGSPPPKTAGKRRVSKRGNQSWSVIAVVDSAPAKKDCPSGNRLRKGDTFSFTSLAPAGLCIDAASALLPTVLALRDAKDLSHDPITVRCSHPECTCVFSVRSEPPARHHNIRT